MSSSHALVTQDPLIDDVLGAWAEAFGRDDQAYRGHVYRTFNFAQALAGYPGSSRELAVAAAFHDLGIWSDDTFDYLEPSAERACEYVRRHHPDLDANAIRRVIVLHHKIMPRRAETVPEAFRRADLVDLSLGVLRCGLPRQFIRDARQAFPNAGFHRCLVRVGLRWALRHPSRPLPMIGW